MKKSNALVMLSGGLDSATCLYWAKEKFSRVYAITFDYYDRIENERKATIALSRKANASKLLKVSIPFIKESSDFYGGRHGPRKRDSRWSSYIPARNIIFYSIAAHFAEFLDIKWIIGGHNRDDGLFFKDATASYLKQMNSLFNKGSLYCGNKPYNLLAPLANLDRMEIINLALKLKVPLALTWSCHRKGEEHCRQCYACMNRIKAFKHLGISDPALGSIKNKIP
ncbi:MAG: queC2 [Nitrososphaeraceae archaeon]|nr:queC2 [Nitrososphaeraceae archaeon]